MLSREQLTVLHEEVLLQLGVPQVIIHLEEQLPVGAQAVGHREAVRLGIAEELVSVSSSWRHHLDVRRLKDFLLHVVEIHGWLRNEEEFLI